MWPLVKRLHRFGSRVFGVVGRRLSVVWGDRRLPRTAGETSAASAAAEPASLTLHAGPTGEGLRRAIPAGDPPGHWTFRRANAADLPSQYTPEITRGLVVGDYAA